MFSALPNSNDTSIDGSVKIWSYQVVGESVRFPADLDFAIIEGSPLPKADMQRAVVHAVPEFILGMSLCCGA